MFKSKKKKNHTSRLRESLEPQSASTTSTISGTTNPRRLIRERLESYPPSNHLQGLGTQPHPNQRQGSRSHPTASSSVTSASDIPDVPPLPTKASAMSHSLWRGYCRCLGIKDSIPAARSLCEYTWEVVVCMVLTGEGRLGPDIWPESPQQAKSTESMMRTTWNIEAMRRRKGSGKPDCPLTPTGKVVRHIHALLFCDLFQRNR